MIRLTEDESWFERAKSGYGAMTCPNCFGEIVKDRMDNVYQCSFCEDNYSNEEVKDFHKKYSNYSKKKDSNIVERNYVVYAEGTWEDSTALFRRLAGPAEWSTESDADKFSLSQAEKAEASKGGKHKWIKKRV